MTWLCKRLESTATIKPTGISGYSKIAGYKVNIHPSIGFLPTSNRQVEFEIKNTIPLTSEPPKIKYLRINLTEYARDLYEEENKTLTNKIKGPSERPDVSCSWRGALGTIEILVLSHLVTDSMRFLPKSQQMCCWYWQTDSNVHLQAKGPERPSRTEEERRGRTGLPPSGRDGGLPGQETSGSTDRNRARSEARTDAVSDEGAGVFSPTGHGPHAVHKSNSKRVIRLIAKHSKTSRRSSIVTFSYNADSTWTSLKLKSSAELC